MGSKVRFYGNLLLVAGESDAAKLSGAFFCARANEPIVPLNYEMFYHKKQSLLSLLAGQLGLPRSNLRSTDRDRERASDLI